MSVDAQSAPLEPAHVVDQLVDHDVGALCDLEQDRRVVPPSLLYQPRVGDEPLRLEKSDNLKEI